MIDHRIFRHLFLLGCGLFLVGLALPACDGDEPVAPPSVVIPGEGEEILYRTHIEPIWLNSCAGSDCHTGGGRAAGLALDSWDRLVAGSDFGAVIIAGAPERSHLFQHINPDTSLGPRATPLMPASRNPLPTEQILLVKRWIAEGAKGPGNIAPLSGPGRSQLLITCQSEDLVAVLDVGTGLLASFIPVGLLPDASSPPEAPHNIVIAPDGGSFYLVMIAAGRVERYSTRTFELLGTADVGSSPSQARFTPDGRYLYVSNFDATRTEPFVYRLDPDLSSPPLAIDIEGEGPHGITFGEQGEFLYTMNAFSDDISIVDLRLSPPEVVGRIPIVPGSPPAPAGGQQHEPYQSEIAADGLMYVTCRKSGQVRVVDLAERRVVDSITVGSRPLIPGLSPDGTEIWIPNQGSNTVSIIATATRSVVGTITDVDSGPHAVLFHPDGSHAWVSCENVAGGENLHHPLEGTEVVPGLLYSIDVSSRTIERVTELAGFAAGLGFVN